MSRIGHRSHWAKNLGGSRCILLEALKENPFPCSSSRLLAEFSSQSLSLLVTSRWLLPASRRHYGSLAGREGKPLPLLNLSGFWALNKVPFPPTNRSVHVLNLNKGADILLDAGAAEMTHTWSLPSKLKAASLQAHYVSTRHTHMFKSKLNLKTVGQDQRKDTWAYLTPATFTSFMPLSDPTK